MTLLLLASAILNAYPSPTYQDILVENHCIAVGSQICVSRYEMIKSVFDSYQRPFTVLEIGAAQGYFTFRIAHDFPNAHCTMIEEDNSHYSYHGSLLADLCQLNQNLNNVSLIRKRLSLEDLIEMKQQGHFDVVLAFLVIHQMAPDFELQKPILDTILTMGDQVLIEMAADASPVLATYTEYLSRHFPCQYLGEIKRYKDPNSPGTGQMYWFKN